MSIKCWVMSPFYDFCGGFWSVAVNTVHKLQFFHVYLLFYYRIWVRCYSAVPESLERRLKFGWFDDISMLEWFYHTFIIYVQKWWDIWSTVSFSIKPPTPPFNTATQISQQGGILDWGTYTSLRFCTIFFDAYTQKYRYFYFRFKIWY